MSAACAIDACSYVTPHVHCPACGMANPAQTLCAHHVPFADEWSVGNRIACDFIHRGVEPPPVVLTEPIAYEDVA